MRFTDTIFYPRPVFLNRPAGFSTHCRTKVRGGLDWYWRPASLPTIIFQSRPWNNSICLYSKLLVRFFSFFFPFPLVCPFRRWWPHGERVTVRRSIRSFFEVIDKLPAPLYAWSLSTMIRFSVGRSGQIPSNPLPPWGVCLSVAKSSVMVTPWLKLHILRPVRLFLHSYSTNNYSVFHTCMYL